MDSALWGLQASRPPINPPPITHIIHVRDIEYMEIMTAHVGQSAV